MEIKKILEDNRLQQLIIDKDLSTSRQKMYGRELAHLYEISGLTPTELIKEAKKEEKPFINDEGLPEILDIFDRRITHYINRYYTEIKQTDNVNDTIDTKLGIVRSFYNHYGLELPKKPEIIIPKNIIREGDIPNKEDIKTAYNNARLLTHKTIFLFVSSTGLRSNDVRYLTVGDYLEATKEYHNGSLENLLEYKEEDILPSWVVLPRKTVKHQNITITFNTYEVSELINQTLKNRLNNNEKISNDSPLFIPRNGENFFTEKGFAYIFESINDNYFGRNEKGRRFFMPKRLRKYFLSTFRRATKDLFALKVVGGHSFSSNNKEHYIQVLIEDTKEAYLKVLPYLSLTKLPNPTEDERRIKELENQLKTMKDKENTLKDEVCNIKGTLKEYAPLIEEQKENKEIRNFWHKQVPKSKILQKIMLYVGDNYSKDYLNDINFIRAVKKLDEENNLDKIKSKYWKKEIGKITDEIKPININDEITKMFNNTK